MVLFYVILSDIDRIFDVAEEHLRISPQIPVDFKFNFQHFQWEIFGNFVIVCISSKIIVIVFI